MFFHPYCSTHDDSAGMYQVVDSKVNLVGFPLSRVGFIQAVLDVKLPTVKAILRQVHRQGIQSLQDVDGADMGKIGPSKLAVLNECFTIGTVTA